MSKIKHLAVTVATAALLLGVASVPAESEVSSGDLEARTWLCC